MAKKKGKAGSHAPKAEKPYWLKLKPVEIEELIINLAKQGLPSSQIGLILRDSYGISSVKAIVGKKIEQIMAEHGLKFTPPEIVALERRVRALKQHFEKHKKDMSAKRGLELAESKLRRLKSYFMRRGKLR